jgi:glycosyltransferase involved in cell wall biosynthesis
MISIVLISATSSFDGVLFPGIDRICRYTDMPYELIVVSPYKIEKEFPNTKFIFEENPIGAVAAINYGAKLSTGDYIATICDDVHVQPGWCGVIRWMEENNQCIGSFKYGFHQNRVVILHHPIVRKDFLYGDLMKGYVFDPAFSGTWADVDLSFRLFQNNVSVGKGRDTIDYIEDHGTGETLFGSGIKATTKRKYLRCDCMVMKSKWPNSPLLPDFNPPWPDSELPNEECERIVRSKMEGSVLCKDIQCGF